MGLRSPFHLTDTLLSKPPCFQISSDEKRANPVNPIVHGSVISSESEVSAKQVGHHTCPVGRKMGAE